MNMIKSYEMNTFLPCSAFFLAIIGLIPALYSFLIYPLILFFLGLVVKTKSIPKEKLDSLSVSILLPAWNEEKFIVQKLDNIKSLERDKTIKLDIIIFDDGSTDQTLKITNDWKAQNKDIDLTIFSSPKNCGKWEALVKLVELSKGNILFINDISSTLPLNILTQAQYLFSEQDISVVAPGYYLKEDMKHRPWERPYWLFERTLRSLESKIHTTVGAHGAGYFIRKSDMINLEQLKGRPLITINDDFIIPTLSVKDGKRILYHSNIAIFENDPSTEKQELNKRIRIARGNYAMMKFIWSELSFKKEFFLKFFCLSHKGMRVLLGPGIIVSIISLGFLLPLPKISLPITVLLLLSLYKLAPIRANILALIYIVTNKEVRW
jgi:biofilm PGA synthesis N-glycosyltransferase PgaC